MANELTQHTVVEAVRDTAIDERNAYNRAIFYQHWTPTRDAVVVVDYRTPGEIARWEQLLARAKDNLRAHKRQRRLALRKKAAAVLPANVLVFKAKGK